MDADKKQMEQKTTKIPLQQVATEDHAAKVLREKIGGPFEKAGGGSQKPVASSQKMERTIHSSTLAPDQKALEQKIIAELQTIFDPEIPLNIYDLGLIYKIEIAATNAVKVEMTLTAPGCPVAGDIVASVKNKIAALPEVPAAEVELVWEPAWSRERLSEAAKLELGLL